MSQSKKRFNFEEEDVFVTLVRLPNVVIILEKKDFPVKLLAVEKNLK